MRSVIRKIFIILPLLLFTIAVWSICFHNTDFPVVGGMIQQSLRQQKNLAGKIEQQKKLLAEAEPELNMLKHLRNTSFPVSKEIVTQFRNRVEQVFQASGARILSISNPTQVKAATGLEVYELKLSALLHVEELQIIMSELGKPPLILYKIVNIRPDNMKNPDGISLEITFAVVSFVDGKQAKPVVGGRK